MSFHCRSFEFCRSKHWVSREENQDWAARVLWQRWSVYLCRRHNPQFFSRHRSCTQAISENLQKDLEETRVWSIKNKMVLSDSKTKCMLVTGKRLESKFSDNCSLHLKLNGTEIKQVNSQKLLGVTIDNKLSFDDHIERSQSLGRYEDSSLLKNENSIIMQW